MPMKDWKGRKENPHKIPIILGKEMVEKQILLANCLPGSAVWTSTKMGLWQPRMDNLSCFEPTRLGQTFSPVCHPRKSFF